MAAKKKATAKAAPQDDPTTPFYDARAGDGKFTKENEPAHADIIKDNAEANKKVEDEMVKWQWEQAKRSGLLTQSEGLAKTYEHPGINTEKPEGV